MNEKQLLMNMKEMIGKGLNFRRTFIGEWYYSFKQGIINLWLYKKIIWGDRWYDHSFLTKLVSFKLQVMIDNWNDSHYIGYEFTKKRMMSIKKHIDTYEDDYEDVMYDFIVHKKYSEEEYRKELKKLNDKSWGRLGRNLLRFWD